MTDDERRAKWREATNKYRRTPKGAANVRKTRLVAAKRDRVKNNARRVLKYHVEIGEIVRPDICDKYSSNCYGRIEGHHDDYSKPLVVRWLCINHHSEAHNGFLVKKEVDNG